MFVKTTYVCYHWRIITSGPRVFCPFSRFICTFILKGVILHIHLFTFVVYDHGTIPNTTTSIVVNYTRRDGMIITAATAI